MFLISGEIIFIVALIAFLMGLGIIGNIDVILSTIGEWAFAFLVAILLIVLIFAICKLIGRKKPIQTTILFFCSLCLLAYGIIAYVDYLTDRHNAFYTINVSVCQARKCAIGGQVNIPEPQPSRCR